MDGVATSSFGTHVANLAGVPFSVVERADLISKKFAEQFKQRLQEKRTNSRLPLTAQADFAYLVGVATGKVELPKDEAKRKLVLSVMRETVKRYTNAGTK